MLKTLPGAALLLLVLSCLLLSVPGAQAQAMRMRNGLPPTVMDSFVHEAQEQAELIYGDEGTVGLPPYESFQRIHRINTGIFDRRDQGLTTGHGSWMPDAWGRDEFIGEQEWSQSGAQGWSELDAAQLGPAFRTPGVRSTAGQFPNGSYDLDWLNGQLDESRWTTPPPVLWNAQNANNRGMDQWRPGPNGTWINQNGRVLARNGRLAGGGGGGTN